jgi:hypothetical protein
MPVSPVSKLYSTEDAKIAKLLSDAPGFASYGSMIDIPGIRQVTMTPQIESKSLRGDNRELDADSTLVAVELSFENAKVSFEALEVFLGGTWNASTGTYTQSDSGSLPYWAMGWRTPTSGGDAIGGDVQFQVFKAKITAHTLGTAFEDYQLLSGTARGVYRVADDKLFQAVVNETASAISI